MVLGRSPTPYEKGYADRALELFEFKKVTPHSLLTAAGIDASEFFADTLKNAPIAVINSLIVDINKEAKSSNIPVGTSHHKDLFEAHMAALESGLTMTMVSKMCSFFIQQIAGIVAPSMGVIIERVSRTKEETTASLQRSLAARLIQPDFSLQTVLGEDDNVCAFGIRFSSVFSTLGVIFVDMTAQLFGCAAYTSNLITRETFSPRSKHYKTSFHS